MQETLFWHWKLDSSADLPGYFLGAESLKHWKLCTKMYH